MKFLLFILSFFLIPSTQAMETPKGDHKDERFLAILDQLNTPLTLPSLSTVEKIILEKTSNHLGKDLSWLKDDPQFSTESARMTPRHLMEALEGRFCDHINTLRKANQLSPSEISEIDATLDALLPPLFLDLYDASSHEAD